MNGLLRKSCYSNLRSIPNPVEEAREKREREREREREKTNNVAALFLYP